MPLDGRIDLHLHPKQVTAFTSPATEIMYGGAAGGGKSHLLRCAAITWAAEIPGLQIYIFRRIQDDLIKNHIEGPNGFRVMLAPWVAAGWVEIVADEIRFNWNGSKIYLCHCKDEAHRFKYDGAEIHVLLIDELTHFSEVIYRFLRHRVRLSGLELPDKYKGMFPRILCGTNPGNVGHLWVKRAWIDGDPTGSMVIRDMPKSEGGMSRQYIPALLEDNPSIDKEEYEGNLEGLGSEALVKAKRWGVWDIVDGAYFDCWDPAKHIIKPFQVPEDWNRIRAFDWGSAAPFSYGEYALSPGFKTPYGLWIPRGAMVKYLEWYGAKRDESGASLPNMGLRLNVEEIADGIKKRTKVKRFSRSVADPAIFAKPDGERSLSMGDRFYRAGVKFSEANNVRTARKNVIGGWDLVRYRLKGQDGMPMIYFFDVVCADTIRTLPALQHSTTNLEDLDTDGEDHCVDELRYACASKPWVPAGNENVLRPHRDRWDRAFGRENRDEDSWRVA